jgi:hypothetical protein
VLVLSNKNIDIRRQAILLRHLTIVQTYMNIGLLGILVILDSSGLLLVFSSLDRLHDRNGRDG